MSRLAFLLFESCALFSAVAHGSRISNKPCKLLDVSRLFPHVELCCEKFEQNRAFCMYSLMDGK